MTAPVYGQAFALWRDQARDWQAYTHHTFVEGLRTGNLPRANFLHYLRQDYLFLIHFARAWALAAAKATGRLPFGKAPVLELDDGGNLLHASGDTISVDASVTPDPEMLEWIAELAGPIEELKSRVVAEAAEGIDGDRTSCRAGECTMGNLVSDAMLARVAGQGISIAIQNGGGLRSSIEGGEVTMGAVLAVLPFQNTLATFQLRGADLLEALENGAGQVEEGAGRFAQVAGLRYTFDLSLSPGSRVSDVMVQDAGEWVPLEPDTLYGVVSNDFMRNGGDGYRMFRDRAQNVYDFGPDLADVLAEYLAANSPYQPYLDGRITQR